MCVPPGGTGPRGPPPGPLAYPLVVIAGTSLSWEITPIREGSCNPDRGLFRTVELRTERSTSIVMRDRGSMLLSRE